MSKSRPNKTRDRKARMSQIAPITVDGKTISRSDQILLMADIKNNAELQKRFWSKVNKLPDDGCWEWIGGKFVNGRPHITIKDDKVLAYRLSYILVHGDINYGMSICHHCDNIICVRPDHLFQGTQSDNSLDMFWKGRQKPNQRTSKYFGVRKGITKGKWIAQLRLNKRYVSLGTFFSEIEAVAMYNFYVAMFKLDLPFNKSVQ